jgi:ribosomal protein S18 acetylase RimI-like enzyme
LPRYGPDDLLIRPATIADLAPLAAIEAERGNGQVDKYYASLASALSSWVAAGDGLVLTAEHAGRTVAIAKVRRFVPPLDAPANVAPAGWYLAGVIVAPEHRRRGIGHALTRKRLDWIAGRARAAYCFANSLNGPSIELHRRFGFVEQTRDFTYPGVEFRGGIGILFRADLSTDARDSTATVDES